MSVETIYRDLRKLGLSHNGACAMMGNMRQESSMRSNNAQDNMTPLTDEQYTKLFDSNPEACINDSIGYGLCQWTLASRKRNLRQFARNWGVSVSAEDMQTEFAVYELKTDFASLYRYLCSDSCDLHEATKRICWDFENPKVKNVEVRYEFALEFNAAFNKGSAINKESRLEEIAKQLESLAAEVRKLK